MSTAKAPKAAPIPKPDVSLYVAAKERASRHRAELEASGHCACFFCFKKFPTSDIKTWIEANQTALCPHCGLDSVLGSGTDHRIDDQFLRKMHQHYYAYRTK
ncbi:MAG: cytoplasmic protein [Kofleriaceae bacterium]